MEWYEPVEVLLKKFGIYNDKFNLNCAKLVINQILGKPNSRN